MIEQKVSELNRYFKNRIASCKRRSKKLFADDREDEALFEEIKSNIYAIFKTILSVAVKNYDSEEDVKKFFIGRIEKIPADWAKSYEKAKQHDDFVKMQIEQIKLDVVSEIKEEFMKVWEGTK